MKINFVGTAFPYRGGLASFNERLVGELNTQGHNAEISTFTLQYPSFLFPGKSQYAEGQAPDNIKITRRVNSINPLNWMRVGTDICKTCPDLLLFKFWLPFMGPGFGTIARRARRNKHTKVITIIDNIIPHEKRPGDFVLARYFVNSCDAFITMSKSVTEDLRKFTSSAPVTFVPHPIYDNFGKIISKEEARSILGIDQEEKLMLFFGIIRSYKGLDLLLEAMHCEKLKALGVKLIVAGEFYEDKEPYMRIIEKYNLADHIILHDHFIANDDVKQYFCAADVVVQPYKSATQSGITQMAYHFEKAMIVTNVGGLPEIVPHGRAGWTVDPNSDAIAVAIERFYTEEKEQIFVKEVQKLKHLYSWGNMVHAIEDLYRQLTDNS